jgi:hypothetical protein
MTTKKNNIHYSRDSTGKTKDDSSDDYYYHPTTNDDELACPLTDVEATTTTMTTTTFLRGASDCSGNDSDNLTRTRTTPTSVPASTANTTRPIDNIIATEDYTIRKTVHSMKRLYCCFSVQFIEGFRLPGAYLPPLFCLEVFHVPSCLRVPFQWFGPPRT